MLYELTLQGRYYGQKTINRWNYISTGESGGLLGSLALLNAFGAVETAGVYPAGGVLKGIMNLLSVAWTGVRITARAASLYDPTDFYELPFVPPITGGSSGDGASPTQAYGFVSTRVRLDIDRGTKRFAGVSESVTGTGGTIDTSGGTAIAILAGLMTDVLEYVDEGNTITFSPCVVGKLEYTTPSGKKAYKYYPTLEAQLEHVALGIAWQPYDTVRTQNSRQYGRGE